MNIRKWSIPLLVLLPFALLVYQALPVYAAEAKKETKNLYSYVASKGGLLYHKPSCSVVADLDPQNKQVFKTEKDAEKAGYRPCGMCL